MVTFNDLISVNIVEGTMTISMFIDYVWTDGLILWGANKTAGNEEILIPLNWVWVPDLLLYNSVDGEAMSWETGQIYLYNDGTVWYSATAVVVISCTYQLLKFPFDTQTCYPMFASWSFADYELNISSVVVDMDDSSFNNLAWNIDSVSASREVITQWEIYNFSFGIFSVTISRYYNHYVSTVILPTILVTCIVLSALWMDNVQSRLSLGITGLLTVIAIQVRVLATANVLTTTCMCMHLYFISVFVCSVPCVVVCCIRTAYIANL